MPRRKVGLVGCGTISGAYLKIAPRFETFEIVRCADVLVERARARADEFGVPHAGTVDDLMSDSRIEIVLNLTIPGAHAEVALAAILAGKSVYNEKPLAVQREEGQAILTEATRRGVRVGGAPDTFLGAGIQSCRKLIDDGAIGEPVAATAFLASHGHESWHPDPDFYYQPGAGPMFDMGPYYLTALINLIGPIRRVTGSTRASFPTRTITSEPKRGSVIEVNTPTHIAGVVDFANGAIGTIITSFDVWSHSLPRLEIYGSEGSLSVPDPNTFGGPVRLRRAGETEWHDVPLSHGNTENSRGIGVADMAAAMSSGRSHRASGELAYHVLDVMHAFLDASREGRHVEIASTCARPTAMPPGLPDGAIDT